MTLDLAGFLASDSCLKASLQESNDMHLWVLLWGVGGVRGRAPVGILGRKRPLISLEDFVCF